MEEPKKRGRGRPMGSKTKSKQITGYKTKTGPNQKRPYTIYDVLDPNVGRRTGLKYSPRPRDPKTAIRDYHGENAQKWWKDKPKYKEMISRLGVSNMRGYYTMKFKRSKKDAEEDTKREVKKYMDYKKNEFNGPDEEIEKSLTPGSDTYAPMMANQEMDKAMYKPIKQEKQLTDRIKGSEYAKFCLSKAILHDVCMTEQAERDRKYKKVDLGCHDWVEQRIKLYFLACSQVGIFPSMKGLATQGFGMGYKNVMNYLSTHDDRSTELIKEANDRMAQIMLDEAKQGNANPVTVIFELKNMHGFQDQTVIMQGKQDPLGTLEDTDKLKEKYLEKVGTYKDVTPAQEEVQDGVYELIKELEDVADIRNIPARDDLEMFD